MRTANNQVFKSVTRMLALLALLVGLSACSNDMTDLRQWVTDVKAKPGGRIDPLPVIPPYKAYVYSAAGGRAPFEPDTETRDAIEGRIDGIMPVEERPREYLEKFPLDALRMVGTIRPANNTLALVQDADGLIHRVTTGNYVGQNHGRIVGVDEGEVKLTEIISDGFGGWMERPAALALGN